MTLNWNIIRDAFTKMLLALICGGTLGVERGRKKRPAGFRTYMLVCLGATLAMMINDYVCIKYGTGDPTRLGAQVISGIGFLGAGTIITTGHNRVKGLTTAAGLWAAACIGLAIGVGYYEGAVVGTGMIVLIMVLLQSFDRRISFSPKLLFLYVELENISAIKKIKAYTKEQNISVIDMETEMSHGLENYKAASMITLNISGKSTHEEIIAEISHMEGVIYVEEI
uniref:MgtC/SapB family protein n=1 Tax=Agathobacter sp. TaxID=2021311 RepID=UPI004056ADA6